MPTLTSPSQSIKADAPNKGKRWTIVDALLEVICLTVVLIIILDLLFALAGIGEQEFLKIDPVTGFAPMNNKHLTWREEGFARVSFNSQAMQDKERPIAKPKGNVRIAVVGDSYVAALQVDRTKNFSTLLEDRLNADRSKHGHFEVLNFGVPAFNLGQMYLWIKTKVWKFEPDILILVLRDNTTLSLAPNPAGGFLSARPTFFVDANGALIEDRTVQNLWNRSAEAKRMRNTAWLREHTHIWGVMANLAGQWQTWVQHAAKKNGHQKFPSVEEKAKCVASERDFTTIKRKKQAEKNIEENGRAQFTRFIWPVAHALIVAIKNECRIHQCRLIIVHLPAVKGYENPLETSLLAKSASSLGVSYLDCNPILEKAQVTEDEPVFFTSHLTEKGHQIVGLEIFTFLQDCL